MQSTANQPIGLYIHVPYCRSKCGYCNFYSLTDETSRASWLDTICQEIRSYAGRGLAADTLYIGGGTPSTLSIDAFTSIVSACRESFELSGEWTVELNPDSANPALLSGLHKLGFSRLSFGLQSAVDSELRTLGRRHNHKQAADAVFAARAAGFSNLSLDLMLGIPDQTADTLRQTLDFAISLKPEHLSAYLLKIEPGTPFDNDEIRDRCADEDTAADDYLIVSSYLEQAGYRHYEISNFALPGRESVHNRKYWRCQEYLGFGPAAHSFFEGRRFYHPPQIDAYLAAGGRNYIDDGIGGSAEERLMLGLRLREGVLLSTCGFSDTRLQELLQKAQPLEKAGFLTCTGGRIALTTQGFLLSNRILATLL